MVESYSENKVLPVSFLDGEQIIVEIVMFVTV